MLVFDAHCDSLTQSLDKNISIRSGSLSVDLEKLRKSAPCVSVFAICLGGRMSSKPWREKGSAYEKAAGYIGHLKENLQPYDRNILQINNVNDLKEVSNSENKAGIMLSLEGGEPLCGELEPLNLLRGAGVCLITLTWSRKNEIACGINDAERDEGLTAFGREVMGRMKSLGIAVDVSHLAPRSFEEVITESVRLETSVIASHSNFTALSGHSRNLTDEQAKAVLKTGGVVCVCSYPPFINGRNDASIEELIRHIEYGAGLIGIDAIGLGSDFDGIGYRTTGLDDFTDYHKLFNKMAQMNYLQDDIDKVAGKNLVRYFMKVFK